MSSANSDSPAKSAAATNEIVFTCKSDAPFDRVFKAWTEVDHLLQWRARKASATQPAR